MQRSMILAFTTLLVAIASTRQAARGAEAYWPGWLGPAGSPGGRAPGKGQGNADPVALLRPHQLPAERQGRFLPGYSFFLLATAKYLLQRATTSGIRSARSFFSAISFSRS